MYGQKIHPSVASRENVHGEGVLRLKLLVAVSLVLGEELGLEDNVSGLVDTVDVSESGSDRESGGDGEEGVVDVEDVLGLGVERGVVDACERGAWSVRPYSDERDRELHNSPVLSTPSSSPPVIPISISSHSSILAMRSKYFTQVAMFSSLDSSERSSMCELLWCRRRAGVSRNVAPRKSEPRSTHEKSGSPLAL
jgi:hypothetical protein